jgi:hypothetical protein
VFNPLEYRLCLEKPRKVTDILGWHEHIPFAFALTEMLKPKIFVELGTHKGDSYLAFCQAVDTLGLETACYAVDTWKGDEQAGYYDEKVFEELKEYHDPTYGRFSTLLRCTFDDALPHFSEGSVDVLHIDGLHSYNAVRHDFETWLPKMSDRGVVLLHDINVRERDFGVWRLWEELVKKYPAFAFSYENGLGVIAVGSDVPAPLADFFAAENEAAERISGFFQVLGSRITLSSRFRAQIAEKDGQIAEQARLLAEQARLLAVQEGQLIEQARHLSEKDEQLRILFNSWSWRITAPLRKIRSLF